MTIADNRTRWFALYVLCLGSLMIVLDMTVVNVALPSIRQDLGFSESSLAWVINAYLLTYGGFLLLGGRLGDLFGHRRLFLAGIALFTLASLACGISTTQWMLVTVLSLRVLPGERTAAISRRLDVAGAVTVTAALMLAVYAIVNGNQNGWTSAETLGLLGGAALLLALFVAIESLVRSPLVPLR